MRRHFLGWRLALLATLILSASWPLGSQTADLAVTNIVPPSNPSPAVGTLGDFTLSVNSAGGSGVWVTAIFTPAVTFSSGSSIAGPCQLVPGGGDPSTTVTCPATGASSVTIRLTPLIAGNLAIVAGIISNELDSDMTSNSLIASVNVDGASVQPPTGLLATQTSESAVLVQWTGPPGGATYYEVSRAEVVGGLYTVLTSNWGPTSFSDGTGVPGHTYIYRARAYLGGTWSGYSNVDPASFFTDFIITAYPNPNPTTVRAAHVIELRTAIDIRRALASWPPVSWVPSDPHNLTIQRADIQQMRDRLDDLGAGSYTDQPLTSYPAGTILIKKEHIQQLRNRVQ